MTLKNRLALLEKKVEKPTAARVWIDWGDDRFDDNGEILTGDEFHQRYPNTRVIEFEWSDGPNEPRDE